MRHEIRKQRGSPGRAQLFRIVVAALGLTALGACVDEKVVYRDGPRFDQPSTAAASFVGYRDTTQKATVCGSCHVSAQAQWSQTAHASAWKTLVSSGSMQAYCQDCHSVGKLGNGTTADGGWATTKDPRYQDVQCESCHGPGLAHISSPSKSNIPLASALADTGRTDGCGECHSGTHNPFVAEWKASGHGAMTAWSSTGPNTRAECQGCHTGQGALTQYGVDARSNYKEKGLTNTAPLPITCVVCHDPHNKTIGKQLRLPIDVADETRNLCMTCHNRRSTPDPTSSRGPHAPQGPLLLSAAGWVPPGATFTGGFNRITTSHGPSGNPRLCAGCHVQRWTVTDKATGKFAQNVVGHRFEAIPCVDANGAPSQDQSCAIDATNRAYKGCAASGCHASEAAARSVFLVARNRIASLNTTLIALLARVPRSEFSTTDTRYTTAEGAKFNSDMAAMAGSVAHNPFYLEALLTASIDQVRKDYNLPVGADVDLRNLLSLGAAKTAATR